MSEKNRTLDAVAQIVTKSLSHLVNPPINRGILPAVGDLVHAVDAEVADNPMRQCLHAGLWLLANDLGRAHTLCQDIPTTHGSAWHAVLHRMEGDFWNSKYWWRHATGIQWPGLMGRIRAELPMPHAEMKPFSSRDTYDPSTFVDLVEAHHETASPELLTELITVQRLEWLALFEECWLAA